MRKKKVLTPEHKLAISVGVKRAYKRGMKKIIYTPELKKKMSESHKGKKGYWAGKKRPELTGKNHYAWIGGNSTLERVRFRDTMQKKVFERDKYTCQLCGQRGGALQVDHIQSWSEYVELRFNIDNCRTLCMACHYEITYGKPMPPKVRAWGHKLKEVSKYV